MGRPEPEQTQNEGLMISLDCSMSKHGEMFLASCEKLGVFDQGRTWDEAGQNLRISLTLFLREFAEQQVLEQVLREKEIQFTAIRAEHFLPEAMETPQVLTGGDVLDPHSAALTRRDEIRKIPVTAYKWAHQRQRLGTV